MTPRNEVPRRGFLKTAAAGSSLLLVQPRTAFGSTANQALRLGLIGSGGRGRWLANLFQKHTNTRIVATHDYFRDQAEQVGNMLDLPANKRFAGLDGYKELLQSGVDAVAVISPPYFHPQQTIDALEAGKHVYLAKPIAVDVPGCEAIVAAAGKHGGTLSTWVDFQTRRNPQHQRAEAAIRKGAIGAPVCGQAFYHTGRLNNQTKPGTDVARLRNWLFDIPLSGDIIVEQNIHAIDTMNWFLNAHPIAAQGTGGRKVRTDVGDCWDHFIVTFTYPNDVLIDFSSTQFLTGFDDICARLFGSEGTVDAHYFGTVSLNAKKENQPAESTGNIYKDGAIANMKTFCESIAKATPVNNTRYSADSTMTGILGRTAAYTGERVAWDAMVAKNEALDPKLDLPADGPDTPREAF